MKGKFIVVEGLDGAGKTTQINLLLSRAAGAGVRLVSANNPSHSEAIGERIRLVLKGEDHLSPELLRLLFACDKMVQWEKIFSPLIDNGINVVCHRWTMSSLAYGMAEGFYLGWLWNLYRYVKIPDISIFIDTPVEICMERIIERGGAEKYENESWCQAVHDRYKFLLRNPALTGKVVSVGGNQPAEKISDIIWEIISREVGNGSNSSVVS